MNEKKRVVLIHAHKNLEHINRLIDSLDYPNFIIYVNIDNKSNININKINNKAILIKKRIPVVWGEYSQVGATLNSLHQIIKEQNNFSHVMFISGQDYPIKSNEYINNFLSKNLDYSFIESFLTTKENKYYVFFARVRYKYFSKYKMINNKIHAVYRLLYKIITKNNYERKMINNYICYSGSQWWNLSKKSIEFILERTKNRKIMSFFKTMHCPDELFFQILLMNSHLKNKIINNNHRYIDWTGCINSPRNLDDKDFNKIILSDALFCRKIETGIGDSLVRKLDEYRSK